jgi:ubiquinone/menaquinone biosynthesis C-methylase UbiE
MAHSAPHDWHSKDFVEAWVNKRSPEDANRAAHFDLMSKLLPIARNQSATILDIGAGYGPLAKVLIEAYPNATLVLQDFSQPMLKKAKERLSVHADRIHFVYTDLMKKDWTDGIGVVDAVVSSMGFHELGAPSRVREIYNEVFPLIKPGGAFLDIDFVNGTDDSTHWLNSSSIMGKDADDPLGTRAWVAGTWQASSSYLFAATVEEKLLWLRESGFSVVDCWWKEMGRALVGGLKAPIQT